MSELFAELRTLVFLLLVAGFTVGLVSKKRITKFIIVIIFMPVLIGMI